MKEEYIMLKKIATDKAPAAIGPYSQQLRPVIFYLLQARFPLTLKTAILRLRGSWLRRSRL